MFFALSQFPLQDGRTPIPASFSPSSSPSSGPLLSESSPLPMQGTRYCRCLISSSSSQSQCSTAFLAELAPSEWMIIDLFCTGLQRLAPVVALGACGRVATVTLPTPLSFLPPTVESPLLESSSLPASLESSKLFPACSTSFGRAIRPASGEFSWLETTPLRPFPQRHFDGQLAVFRPFFPLSCRAFFLLRPAPHLSYGT